MSKFPSAGERKKETYRVPSLLDLDDLEPLLLPLDVLVDGAHHARDQLDRCFQVLYGEMCVYTCMF